MRFRIRKSYFFIIFNYETVRNVSFLICLIPVNKQFLYIYNLTLGNGSNDFREIKYAGGFEKETENTDKIFSKYVAINFYLFLI